MANLLPLIRNQGPSQYRPPQDPVQALDLRGTVPDSQLAGMPPPAQSTAPPAVEAAVAALGSQKGADVGMTGDIPQMNPVVAEMIQRVQAAIGNLVSTFPGNELQNLPAEGMRLRRGAGSDPMNDNPSLDMMPLPPLNVLGNLPAQAPAQAAPGTAVGMPTFFDPDQFSDAEIATGRRLRMTPGQLSLLVQRRRDRKADLADRKAAVRANAEARKRRRRKQISPDEAAAMIMARSPAVAAAALQAGGRVDAAREVAQGGIQQAEIDAGVKREDIAARERMNKVTTDLVAGQHVHEKELRKMDHASSLRMKRMDNDIREYEVSASKDIAGGLQRGESFRAKLAASTQKEIVAMQSKLKSDLSAIDHQIAREKLRIEEKGLDASIENVKNLAKLEDRKVKIQEMLGSNKVEMDRRAQSLQEKMGQADINLRGRGMDIQERLEGRRLDQGDRRLDIEAEHGGRRLDLMGKGLDLEHKRGMSDIGLRGRLGELESDTQLQLGGMERDTRMALGGMEQQTARDTLIATLAAQAGMAPDQMNQLISKIPGLESLQQIPSQSGLLSSIPREVTAQIAAAEPEERLNIIKQFVTDPGKQLEILKHFAPEGARGVTLQTPGGVSALGALFDTTPLATVGSLLKGGIPGGNMRRFFGITK